MNICDQEELKHQLLQKFYELAERPELWTTGSNAFYYCGTFRLWVYNRSCLDYGDVTLSAGVGSNNLINIHQEFIGIKKTLGWLFKRTSYAENTSQFVTTALDLAKQVDAITKCKALEEALKRASQEAKPK